MLVTTWRHRINFYFFLGGTWSNTFEKHSSIHIGRLQNGQLTTCCRERDFKEPFSVSTLVTYKVQHSSSLLPTNSRDSPALWCSPSWGLMIGLASKRVWGGGWCGAPVHMISTTQHCSSGEKCARERRVDDRNGAGVMGLDVSRHYQTLVNRKWRWGDVRDTIQGFLSHSHNGNALIRN